MNLIKQAKQKYYYYKIANKSYTPKAMCLKKTLTLAGIALIAFVLFLFCLVQIRAGVKQHKLICKNNFHWTTIVGQLSITILQFFVFTF